MTVSPATPPAPRLTDAIPGLRYHDAPAAIAWLVDVLGAEARHVYPGPNGTVAHAELWFGGGCVMLGSVKDDGLPPRPGHGSIYLVVGTPDLVDALHARAAAAGARVVRPLHDTEYGSHDFGCADPEGNVWHVGTYAVRPNWRPQPLRATRAQAGRHGRRAFSFPSIAAATARASGAASASASAGGVGEPPIGASACTTEGTPRRAS